jgi:DDE superfamily endonuclease
MNCSTLTTFRNSLYACFGNAKDALMNTCDALLTETSAHSFPELSLSPFFARRWSSLYEAFDDATLDSHALQTLFVSQARTIADQSKTKSRLLLAADATPIVRRESRCARDRTYVHVPNLPSKTTPVAPGWQFATIVALPEQPSSWTTILDNRRIKSDQTVSQVVAEQLKELSPQLPEGTIVACDGGFGNPIFLSQVQDLPLGLLLRTANNRVLYRPAPPRTNKRGAPRKDGEAFVLRDSSTHGCPSEEWSGKEEPGHDLQISAWEHLHFKKCRSSDVTLIRIQRLGSHDSKESKREPQLLWLLWHGPDMPPLKDIPRLYRLRYCIEHSYRFDKQELLWEEPRLRTPEKFETWTYAVSAVHNQITLAHFLTSGMRQPWESSDREPTPQQVRRACGRIIAQLGTPAGAPRVRGKSPGRRKGAKIRRAERFPTIFKETNTKKK